MSRNSVEMKGATILKGNTGPAIRVRRMGGNRNLASCGHRNVIQKITHPFAEASNYNNYEDSHTHLLFLSFCITDCELSSLSS